MKTWYQNCSIYFKDRAFVASFVWAWIFLAASLVVNFYAATYATIRASNPVTDIILDNVRVYNVDEIFIYGPVLLFAFLAYLLAANPQKFPFVIKSLSLFVIIRSIFITLTHIGPFPTRLIFDPTRFITHFTSGNDLFFSAHTGMPFLFALIFWQNKSLRWIFTFCSVVFGIVVLLGHLHYSIDVASAFFITYAIYHLALQFFPKDKAFFDSKSTILS